MSVADSGIISIHAPREGGDGVGVGDSNMCIISIHAPREGGDDRLKVYMYAPAMISIHAPREGGDLAVKIACP